MVSKLEKKFVDGKQTLFFSSSENMHHLNDNSINVIITSPPYNVGKDYNINKDDSTDNVSYDDRKTFLEYIAFLKRVFTECYRVLSEDGVFFLNVGDSAKDQGKSEDVVRCAIDTGFKRLQTVIWIKSIFGKGHYTPSGGNRRLNNVWEYVYILIKSKRYNIDPRAIGIPYADKSNIGRYSKIDLRDAGDIWFIPYSKTTGATIKKGHEAPFPIELALRCLKLVPHAKTVLDPFAGTGSTLRATKELNLIGYGYEILPRLDIIKQRLKEKISDIKTPLLPQLNTYTKLITKLFEESLMPLSHEEISKITEILKKIDRKKFIWACKDLGVEPSILKYFPEDSIRLDINGKRKEDKKDSSVRLNNFLNR
jgi:site-specific DNA-methyltransferase (adenine-specific)